MTSLTAADASQEKMNTPAVAAAPLSFLAAHPSPPASASRQNA